MTLGELREDLKKYGIRQVGVLRVKSENGKQYVSVTFSSDEKIVFPYRLKNGHPLVLPSDDDSQKVNIEAIKALKRRLIPGWDEE